MPQHLHKMWTIDTEELLVILDFNRGLKQNLAYMRRITEVEFGPDRISGLKEVLREMDKKLDPFNRVFGALKDEIMGMVKRDLFCNFLIF